MQLVVENFGSGEAIGDDHVPTKAVPSVVLTCSSSAEVLALVDSSKFLVRPQPAAIPE